MNTLVCGPYVGEFGWEICSWSGYCRAISRHFDETIAITRVGHDALYSDFAKVMHIDLPLDAAIDCEVNSAVSRNDFVQLVQPLISPTTFWLPPFRPDVKAYQHWLQPTHIPAIKASIVGEYPLRLSSIHSKRTKVLLHARNRSYARVDKNVPMDLFVGLAQRLKDIGTEVVSIGGSESLHVEGTIDALSIPLSELALLMDSAICVLGPVSGPLHFAKLVNCPTIAWSTDPLNSYHYNTGWNPHDAKTVYINIANPNSRSNFHPSIELLCESVKLIQEKGIEKMILNDVYSIAGP